MHVYFVVLCSVDRPVVRYVAEVGPRIDTPPSDEALTRLGEEIMVEESRVLRELPEMVFGPTPCCRAHTLRRQSRAYSTGRPAPAVTRRQQRGPPVLGSLGRQPGAVMWGH